MARKQGHFMRWYKSIPATTEETGELTILKEPYPGKGFKVHAISALMVGDDNVDSYAELLVGRNLESWTSWSAETISELTGYMCNFTRTGPEGRAKAQNIVFPSPIEFDEDDALEVFYDILNASGGAVTHFVQFSVLYEVK